jgi:alcohol dehydrogenase class IV
MSRASHLAGKAINISKTTAPHALSYYLTSNHEIAHGMAVALTLSTMLAYNAEVTNSDCVDPRGADHVRKRIATICSIMQAPDVESACANIEKMITGLDCPASLSGAGIVERNVIRKIVDSANMERMSNNPRRIDSATLLDLLTKRAP